MLIHIEKNSISKLIKTLPANLSFNFMLWVLGFGFWVLGFGDINFCYKDMNENKHERTKHK